MKDIRNEEEINYEETQIEPELISIQHSGEKLHKVIAL